MRPTRRPQRASPVPAHIRTQGWSVLDFTTRELAGATLEEIRTLPWAEAGVATVESSRVGYRLRVGGFAGRITLPGDVTVDIEELVPGTVASLAPLAAGGRRWRYEWQATGRAELAAWLELAETYGERLYDYVATGIDRRYLPQVWLTTRPRGHVNARRTATAWAHGRRPALSCDARPLTDDTPLNRYLLSAALRADSILATAGVGGPAATSLRTAMNALSGATYVAWPSELEARAALEPGDDVSGRLVGLAKVIITSVAALPEKGQGQQPVDVWFDVPRVFESAVRELVSIHLKGIASVRNGRGDGVQLLRRPDAKRDVMAADPDVVVEARGRTILLDAKYRRTGADVSREQLYQLIAHAQAYRAFTAALVVPRLSPGPTLQRLGSDRNGTSYYVLAVDCARLDDVEETLYGWLDEMLAAQAVAAS